ncbi:hypothetical protein [Streptomyces albidoflavus]|uniref:hypothetical protein n=1 Tax=Streptomyces albidoflavus TaxID=1886 RepID=UPI001020E569|nr:hypothetical protein [Streptomyces albidoflavus]
MLNPPLAVLEPLTGDAVRWHDDPQDARFADVIEDMSSVLAGLVDTAWRKLKADAARKRREDPALHRLMANLHVDSLDVTDTGLALSLYVPSRGTHDLLHARTGRRMAAALTALACTPVRVADCDSRLRWTRGIRCEERRPGPVPLDPAAFRARLQREEDVIVGRRDAGGGRQAASCRLLLALSHRLDIHPGALWAGLPLGMVILRCTPEDARRLLALGIPARPRLDGEFGTTVAFTLTEQECGVFADVVAAVRPAPDPAGQAGAATP